jgi:hypothetical protein
MATHETDTHTGHVDMEEEFGLGARMGKSLVKGILIGLPLAYVGLVAGLLLLTERDFVKSIETAVLPGMLIGVFFGGFFGMAIMLLGVERQERQARSRRRHGK